MSPALEFGTLPMYAWHDRRGPCRNRRSPRMFGSSWQIHIRDSFPRWMKSRARLPTTGGSRRYDGILNAREYAEGIVEGRDAHIRWQDRMFAEERMKGTAHDRNIDKAMLGEIASEVAAYRSRARR